MNESGRNSLMIFGVRNRGFRWRGDMHPASQNTILEAGVTDFRIPAEASHRESLQERAFLPRGSLHRSLFLDGFWYVMCWGFGNFSVFSETFRKIIWNADIWRNAKNLRLGPNGRGYGVSISRRQHVKSKFGNCQFPNFPLICSQKFNASRAIISYGVQPHGSIFSCWYRTSSLVSWLK